MGSFGGDLAAKEKKAKEEESSAPASKLQAQKQDSTWGNTHGASEADPVKRHLSAAEQSAAKQRGMGGAVILKPSLLDNRNRPLIAVEKKDENGQSTFKNAVLGAKTNAISRINKGYLKRSIPSIAITIVITMVGILMGGTQALMPFSLVSQLKGQFDTIGASTSVRSRTFLKIQLDGGRVKNCTKATIFGGQKFDLSRRQIAKLADSGITYDKKSKTLNFVDVDGTTKAVKAADFEATYNSNEKFRSEYYEGSKTWRGAVADWFDQKATKILEFMGFKRNKYTDRVTGDAETDDANFKSNMEGQAPEGGASSKTKSKEGITEETDEDNKTTVSRTQNEDEVADLALSGDDVEVDSAGRPKVSQSTLSKKLNDFSAKYGKVTGIASAAAQTTCGVMNIISAIGALIAAMQTIEVVKTAAAFLEVPDKASSGADSSDTPTNSEARLLLEKKENIFIDKEGNRVKRTASAMEAESVKALYEERPAESSDLAVRGYNFSSMLSAVSRELSIVQSAINVSTTSFKACLYTKMAAAAIDAVGDVLEIAACIVSFGIGCAVSAIKSAAISLGFSVIISTIVKAMIPWVAQILARNVLKGAGIGEELGNEIVNGGMKMMSENHQYGGGSFMDEKGFSNFLTLQAQYHEEIARYERENLSPFDVRSENTFLGSIMTKLIPVTVQSGSILSGISSMTNVVSKSVSSLLPAASAIDSTVTASEAADRTNQYCPYVASVGAVADEYCNPYVGTDMTTTGTNYDPADVVNIVAAIDENLGSVDLVENDDGTVQLASTTLAVDSGADVAPIRKGSRIANWITFCSQKQSQLGMPDQNVIDAVDGTSTGSTLGDSFLGAIPVFGDIIDAISNAIQLAWYGYISGEACVMNNNSGSSYVDENGNVLAVAIDGNGNKVDLARRPFSTDAEGNVTYVDQFTGNVPSWSEAKYYQRYIEDQRLAEASGLIEKSSVTAFLEEYYKEHPLDNSYEGILARRSGLTKDQVVIALDLLDYNEFLASYDPTEMYPLAHESEDPDYRIENHEDIDSSFVMAMNNLYDIEKRRLATVG